MAFVTFKVLFAFGFPIAVQLGSEHPLPHASGRAVARSPLTAEKETLLKALNPHWFGNVMAAAKRRWSWLNGAARQATDKFPAWDVLFPFVYGGALAVSLWWVWATLGHPFHPAWIAVPLAMILTADWTEHLIQLVQLRHYLPSTEGRIPDLWVRISNCVTIIKLWLTLGFYVSLAGLVVRMILRLSDRQLVTGAGE